MAMIQEEAALIRAVEQLLETKLNLLPSHPVLWEICDLDIERRTAVIGFLHLLHDPWEESSSAHKPFWACASDNRESFYSFMRTVRTGK